MDEPNIYIFIEDCVNTSHHELWKLINTYIYNDKLIIKPCLGLFKVKSLFEEVYNDLSEYSKRNSIFIFVLDNVLDNRKVEKALDYLNINLFNEYKNTYLLDILCFEDIFLSFPYLDKWIFCDDFRNRDKTQKRLSDFYSYKHDKNKFLKISLSDNYLNNLGKTSENLVSSLLSNVSAKTNFHICKHEIGSCWKIDCGSGDCPYMRDCYINVPLNCRCGLWKNKITVEEKLKYFYKYSCLNESIEKAKIYFLSHDLEIAENLIIL